MAQRTDDPLVKDYMTVGMITINHEQSVLEAVDKMVQKNISSVAIVDDNDRIIGILTERDIVKAVQNRTLSNNTAAGSLMSRPIATISGNSHVEDAAKTMAANKIRHLLVTEPINQQVVGIITVTDLARYLKHNLAELTDEEVTASEVWKLFF
jgi:CBS domain-containing protein